MNNYPRFIPELGKHAPADGKKYRPSNSTEGSFFEQGWCDHCKVDKAFRENGYETTNGIKGCDILARALSCDVRSNDYPIEWQWQKGEPVCTAFDDEALTITNEERAAQLPLID